MSKQKQKKLHVLPRDWKWRPKNWSLNLVQILYRVRAEVFIKIRWKTLQKDKNDIRGTRAKLVAKQQQRLLLQFRVDQGLSVW